MEPNIFFTSDTHYNHKNIVRGASEWIFEKKEDAGIQEVRDFNTLEEHNKTLVDRINSKVKENDILYHLGDWSFGGIGSIWEFRKQIRCKNIHLIFGNHDHHIENNKYLPNVAYNHKYAICNDFIDKTENTFNKEVLKVGAKEIFSSTNYYLELKIKEYRFVLSHYAMRVWNKSHHGSIHLYGHSHGSLPGIGRSMDVGVDTNNLYPYHIDEILDKLSKVEVKIVDHNKNTN